VRHFLGYGRFLNFNTILINIRIVIMQRKNDISLRLDDMLDRFEDTLSILPSFEPIS
jgi:hypothetical protein